MSGDTKDRQRLLPADIPFRTPPPRVDLEAEFLSTVSTRCRHRPCFDDLNLPPEAYADWGTLGVAPILTNGQFFELHKHGKHAVILTAHDGFVRDWKDPLADAPIGDLVAFFPDNPFRFYFRRGDMWALGSGLHDNLHMRPSVFLFETPLDWLRAGRDGLCVLDWKCGVAKLADLGRKLKVQNPQFGGKVQTRIRTYLDERSSKIFVDDFYGPGIRGTS